MTERKLNSRASSAESAASTTSSTRSAEDVIPQQEIDALRNRVDQVLANLVGTSKVDTSKLRSSMASLRETPSGADTVVQANKQRPLTGEEDRTTPGATPMEDGKHWVVDPYGDQGQYEGEFDDSKQLPSGQGTMEYTDGRIYVGEWKLGQWHGYGQATFANLDIYIGDYHQDQRHGNGDYQWKDGRRYVGEFVMDQRQGQGLYTWPDGANYDGTFYKGLRHGKGNYTFQDGSVYNGDWVRGKYHGYGECHWVDGRVYKGNWAHGKANGQGIEIRPDGSIRHDGPWENDKPVRTNINAQDTKANGIHTAGGETSDDDNNEINVEAV